jgi:hypothetical protein
MISFRWVSLLRLEGKLKSASAGSGRNARGRKKRLKRGRQRRQHANGSMLKSLRRRGEEERNIGQASSLEVMASGLLPWSRQRARRNQVDLLTIPAGPRALPCTNHLMFGREPFQRDPLVHFRDRSATRALRMTLQASTVPAAHLRLAQSLG